MTTAQDIMDALKLANTTLQRMNHPYRLSVGQSYGKYRLIKDRSDSAGSRAISGNVKIGLTKRECYQAIIDYVAPLLDALDV